MEKYEMTEQDLRAACTHKNRDRTSALIRQSDDLWCCTICGSKFTVEPPPLTSGDLDEARDFLIKIMMGKI